MSKTGYLVSMMLFFWSSGAFAQEPIKYIRFGLGHSTIGGGLILESPLKNRDGQPVEILNFPASCYTAPGITEFGGFGVERLEGSYVALTNTLEFLGKNNISPVKITCGGDSAETSLYLEASSNGDDWFIWDTPPDRLVNQWISSYVEEYVVDNLNDQGELSFLVLEGGSTRILLGDSFLLALLTNQGRIVVAVESDSVESREAFIKELKFRGLDAGQSNPKDQLLLTYVIFESVNPHEMFKQIREAFQMGLRMVAESKETGLILKYGENYIDEIYKEFISNSDK